MIEQENVALNTSAQSESNQTPLISMRAVNKWYGDYHALVDINLEVTPGEKIVVCGPSGSGKSTLIDALML